MKQYIALIVLLMLNVSAVLGQELTPEITPEATALPLTETYTSEDGSISFQCPAGWVIRISLSRSDGLYFAFILSNNEPRTTSLDLEVDEVLASMSISEIRFLKLFGVTGNEINPADVVRAMQRYYLNLAEENDLPLNTVEMGDITPLLAGNEEGARTLVRYWPLGETLIVVTEENDDTYSTFIANAAPSEVYRWEPTILTIMESIQINEP